MSIIGYSITLLSLYTLYVGEVFFGLVVFIVGGFLAKKLFMCLRSLGVVMMLGCTAFGFHNAYTPMVLFLIFIGFIFACFNTKRTSQHDGNGGWGIDFDAFSSGSDSGGGGDCGGGGD